MRCEEKYRLIGLYKAEVERYSTAVEDLTSTLGKTSKQEYDRLRASADAARETSEEARTELDRHTQKHGC